MPMVIAICSAALAPPPSFYCNGKNWKPLIGLAFLSCTGSSICVTCLEFVSSMQQSCISMFRSPVPPRISILFACSRATNPGEHLALRVAYA